MIIDINLSHDGYYDLTRKAINFDLDTNKIKEVYPKTYTNAYYEIKEYLEDIGYKHRQGSGYISVHVKTFAEVEQDMIDLSNILNWLKYCIKKIDVTSVGDRYDMLEVIND